VIGWRALLKYGEPGSYLGRTVVRLLTCSKKPSDIFLNGASAPPSEALLKRFCLKEGNRKGFAPSGSKTAIYKLL